MAEKANIHGLDERSQEILRMIVSSYIRFGEPVGSRTISKTMNRRLSPATIRNIMADLEDAGYLSQPHTSAGRIPSEKGYRFYVDNIGASPRPAPSAEAYIQDALSKATTPEELMSTACYLLSDLCKNVGIVVSAPIDVSVVRQIDFIRLDDTKILVILVSQSGLVQQKVIHVGEPFTQDELIRAGNYLMDKFAGWTLRDIRRELVRLMREERIQYDRMMRQLVESWNRSFEPGEASAESVYVQGTGHILSSVDMSDVARMQELFRVFEEKGRLVKILNECLRQAGDPAEGEGVPGRSGTQRSTAAGKDSPTGGRRGERAVDQVQIVIGSELGDPCLKGFTVISSPYLQKESAAGFMGIIGPTRMEYRKGISVVSYLAEVCGRMIHS